MATTTDPPQEDRSPWSRTSVLVSGAFVLLLVMLGIVVAVVGSSGNAPAHKTAPSVSTPPASSTVVTKTTPGTSTTACTLPAGSQSIPYNSPPAGTQWGLVGSMQVPQASSLYGPQRTSGVFNTCFAHSPTGALLAAFNLWSEGTAANPSQVFQRLAIGAPKNLGNNDRLDAFGPVQWAGYKFESYTSSTAQVIVVLKGYRGAYEAVGTTMRWTGSDWRYLFPPNGVPSLETLSDLSGYVQWTAF